jgi:hypothetical protein
MTWSTHVYPGALEYLHGVAARLSHAPHSAPRRRFARLVYLATVYHLGRPGSETDPSAMALLGHASYHQPRQRRAHVDP